MVNFKAIFASSRWFSLCHHLRDQKSCELLAPVCKCKCKWRRGGRASRRGRSLSLLTDASPPPPHPQPPTPSYNPIPSQWWSFVCFKLEMFGSHDSAWTRVSTVRWPKTAPTTVEAWESKAFFVRYKWKEKHIWGSRCEWPSEYGRVQQQMTQRGGRGVNELELITIRWWWLLQGNNKGKSQTYMIATKKSSLFVNAGWSNF